MASFGAHALIALVIIRVLNWTQSVSDYFFIGMLCPDIDLYGSVIVAWSTSKTTTPAHRTVTHSIAISTIGLVIGLLIAACSKRFVGAILHFFERIMFIPARYKSCDSSIHKLFAIFAGVCSHCLLDLFFGFSGVHIGWPFYIHANMWNAPPGDLILQIFTVLDAILAVCVFVWLAVLYSNHLTLKIVTLCACLVQCAPAIYMLAVNAKHGYLVLTAIELLVLTPLALALFLHRPVPYKQPQCRYEDLSMCLDRE